MRRVLLALVAILLLPLSAFSCQPPVRPPVDFAASDLVLADTNDVLAIVVRKHDDNTIVAELYGDKYKLHWTPGDTGMAGRWWDEDRRVDFQADSAIITSTAPDYYDIKVGINSATGVSGTVLDGPAQPVTLSLIGDMLTGDLVYFRGVSFRLGANFQSLEDRHVRLAIAMLLLYDTGSEVANR